MATYAYINTEINDTATDDQRAAIAGYVDDKALGEVIFIEGGRPINVWPDGPLGELIKDVADMDGNILIFPKLTLLGRSQTKIIAMIKALVEGGISVHAVFEDTVFSVAMLDACQTAIDSEATDTSSGNKATWLA